MPPFLIGISGVKQSGKGTAFRMIAESGRPLGLSAKERGFADYVKWLFARQFFPAMPMEDAIAWCDQYKEDKHAVVTAPRTSVTFRQALQHLGTDCMRDLVSNSFWVDLLLPIEPTASNPEGWYGSFMVGPTAEEWPYSIADLCGVTDLRFEQELERIDFFREHPDTPAHVSTIKLRRKVAEDAVLEEARRLGREIHRSELGLADELFDHVVHNDGTLADLQDNLAGIMSQWRQ
jgi:hypothetical protein